MKILYYYPVSSAKRFEPLIAIKGSAFFRRPNYDAMRLAYLSKENDFYYFDERVEDNPNIEADIVVFPIPLALAYYTQNIAKVWRKRGVKTIAFGVYPSLFFNEAKHYFDVVVRGDITAVWDRILEDYKNRTLTNCYEAGKRPVSFRVRREFEKKYGFTPIISQLRTSYGCHCALEFKDFCYENVIYKDYFLWNPQQIAREVGNLARKMVYVMDDDFLHNLDYTIEILKRCWRYKKMWIFQTTKNIFKQPNIMGFLKEHGVRIIYLKEDWLGMNIVEKIYDRDFVKEREYEINMIHNNRMSVGAKIILGFGGENVQFYRDFLKMLMNIKLDFIEIAVNTPFPYTKIYKKYERDKRVNKDLSLYDKWMPVIRLDQMNQNEVYNWLEFLRDRFYSWDTILRKLIVIAPKLGFYNLFFFYLVPSLSYRDNFLEKVGYPP